jgi:hypothetical protein
MDKMISDEEYAKYVKYVGQDDALPKNQLDIFDTTDHFRNKLPIKSWPTRTTRRNSEIFWNTYNKNLQTDKSKKDIDLVNHLDELLYKCVITSKWPREKAVQKCSEQIKKIKKAIDTLPNNKWEEFIKKIEGSFE